MTKILGTFRIDSEVWNAFREWANSQSSNASTELNRFVLSCLGRIDNLPTDLDNCLEQNLDTKIDNYLEQNLDSRIEHYLEQNLDTRIDIKIKELGEKSLA